MSDIEPEVSSSSDIFSCSLFNVSSGEQWQSGRNIQTRPLSKNIISNKSASDILNSQKNNVSAAIPEF